MASDMHLTDLPPTDSALPDRPALRLLVVDDSEPIRIYMRAKLTAIGKDCYDLHIETARSGEEALEACARDSFDLVFLDVVMPGMGGFEACRQIKATYGTTVAIVSSLRGQDEHAKAFMAGCDTYLDKPIRDADLQAALRQAALAKLD